MNFSDLPVPSLCVSFIFGDSKKSQFGGCMQWLPKSSVIMNHNSGSLVGTTKVRGGPCNYFLHVFLYFCVTKYFRLGVFL